MDAVEKKIIGFEAPKEWWDILKRIGTPSGTRPSQLMRQAVYEMYIKPEMENAENGDAQATTEHEESERKSA